MRIEINIGSDYELSDEQKKTINEQMQKRADEFPGVSDMRFIFEDHSHADGGDYFLIFEREFGVDFDEYMSLLNDITSLLMSVLGPEYHKWWIAVY